MVTYFEGSMGKKLTKRDIDGFNYEGGWDVRWDSSLSGFGVRIYPSGKKSYVLSYRNEKRQKRLLTIGQTSKITLDIARNKALKNLAQLVDDIDPAEERKSKNIGRTVENVFKEYLERYAKVQNKSWKETERMFQKDIIPAFGNKLIQDVTKQDVIKLLDKVVDRGSGTMANRILANIRRFFNWCIERDIIQTSPAEKLAKPTPDISRDRVLSESEIKDILEACEIQGYPYGHLVKFLLLTAQRINEASTMRWKDVNFDQKLWILPRENTKTDKRHEIPLSPMAISILESAQKQCPEKADYVFTTLGDRPFSGFSKSKKRIDNTIGDILEWRIHDLRRTAASGMASLGVSPYVIERVLNHSSGIISGVAAVYNRYDYQIEMQEALEAWAESIENTNDK